jgi:SAM-dependent methyltransferase
MYADIYDQEVIDFWNSFPSEFLQRFANSLPGKRVLDVGSGSGRDALLLKDLGLDVVCLDGSESMIRMTSRLGFDSHLADFEDIDFQPATFDGIWAYTSLIHIPKAEAESVIQVLRTLLKPGGVFAVGVIGGKAEGMVERKTMPDVQRYFKDYLRQELREMVEQQGFDFLFELDYRPHNSVYINQLFVESAQRFENNRAVLI